MVDTTPDATLALGAPAARLAAHAAPAAADPARDPRSVRAGRAVRRLDRALRPDRADPRRVDLRAAVLDAGRQHARHPRHRFPEPRRAFAADLRRPRVAD